GAVKGPLSKTEELQVARYIGERIQYPVGLDVWTRKESGFVRTDRDTCTHCDDVLLAMRQLATLHPALSITPYDLDRFADRAEQAGVDTVPTTILRGSGRSLRFVGLPSGLLFPAFLDLIWFVSNGVTPVGDETRAALRAIEERVDIEVMVTPYDGYSAYMARLLGAFAVESRQLRVRITEMAEF